LKERTAVTLLRPAVLDPQTMGAAMADDKPSTAALSLPPGLHVVAEVVAVEGPDTARDQLARRRRKVFLQDPATGVLFAFPEPPEFWRTPAADEVLATGTLTRLRPRGGTLLQPVWPSPAYENVTVIVSDVISNKPPPVLPGGRDVAVLNRKPVEPAVPPPPSEPAAPTSPPGQGEPEELRGAAVWIAAEARRMKADGEILPDIRITKFSRDLADRMKKAAENNQSIRPVKWTFIKNNLRDWGLWPVSRIKVETHL
jgi:hypothetical protein